MIDFEKSVRTHDEVYLRRDRYDEPLEIFKFAANIIEKRLPKAFSGDCLSLDMLDVGAATGEFLYYLIKI